MAMWWPLIQLLSPGPPPWTLLTSAHGQSGVPFPRLASKLGKSRFPLSPSSLGKYEPTPSPAPGRLLLPPLATWGPGL